MDIEKLKRCLKCCADDNSKACNKCELEYGEEECQNLCGYAATALSALQIENQALRNAASGFKAENEKLRDEVERQRRSADNRQHLYENAERAYMKVLAELEQAKREQSRIPEGYALVKLELLEELDNFRDLGSIDRLRELAQADREGRCFIGPFVAMIEQSLSGGEMKPQRDQRFNGRYAVVYFDPKKWSSPLIDICGTPYNREEAEERMKVLKAALRREQDEKGGSSE